MKCICTSNRSLISVKRNAIWFTDARVNALGNIDIQSGKTALYRIPTNNSGIMGVILSPDNKTIWFAEIMGNKIGSFDIESKSMTEFPTGDLTGPTLLAFDNNGQLWATLSYSNGILKVEPWLLIPGSRANGMSDITLEKPDIFSPFGIGITQNKDNVSRIFRTKNISQVVHDMYGIHPRLMEYLSYSIAGTVPIFCREEINVKKKLTNAFSFVLVLILTDFP